MVYNCTAQLMDRQEASITESDLERMLLDETAEPKPLPFSLLERITNGFSYKMEVGRGGFSVVYKVRGLSHATPTLTLTNQGSSEIKTEKFTLFYLVTAGNA